MRMRRRAPKVSFLLAAALSASLAAVVAAVQAPGPPALDCAAMEKFLKTARAGRQRELPVGVTAPSRATFDDGTRQHDASIQTVDIRAPTYQTSRGTELNFRDTWKFNVAGYELAKLLELNMVPPYVERKIVGAPASVSWWVNDAMMERDRVRKNLTPPDIARWNDEMHAARLFHELIGDSDFNMTNTLIAPDWRVWMIDFSRAFRLGRALQYAKEVTRIDRKLLTNLRGLTPALLQQRLGSWLTRPEIEAVLARRDLLVRALDEQIATKGEAAVLYDLPRVAERCGTGLE